MYNFLKISSHWLYIIQSIEMYYNKNSPSCVRWPHLLLLCDALLERLGETIMYLRPLSLTCVSWLLILLKISVKLNPGKYLLLAKLTLWFTSHATYMLLWFNDDNIVLGPHLPFILQPRLKFHLPWHIVLWQRER